MKCSHAIWFLLFAVAGALKVQLSPRQRIRPALTIRQSTPLQCMNIHGDVIVQKTNNVIGSRSFMRPVKGLASALLPLALPLALPMVLIGIFKVNPTIAATTGAMAAGKGSKKSNSQELRAILNSRFGSGGKMSILQKIFLGVNARGKLSNWKAGDTRTEISMLINGLSMCAILGVWAAGAYVVQKREEAAELRNMRREVVREKEYRENMYFEAVEDIQKRLADPNIKSGKKANLLKQLKELDPDGRIRAFVNDTDNKERPDLSDVVGNKKRASRPDTRDADRSTSGGATGTSSKPNRVQGVDSHDIESDHEDTVKSRYGSSSSKGNGGGAQPPSRSNSNTGGRSSAELTGSAEQDIFEIEPDNEQSDAGHIREMLLELRERLVSEKALSRGSADKFIRHLSRNFARVYGDTAKRSASIRRVQDRLEDTEYWVNMANQQQ